MAETILGTDGNTDVSISLWDRKQGCYIIGANGTGKSVLIENMVAQDIAEGLGVCVLDPHGDLINAIINRIPDERLEDVILLDPLDTGYPFPLNLFYCPDSSDPKLLQLTIEQIEAVFRKVWGASTDTPRLNQYVRNIARVFIPTGYTIVEIPNFLRNKSPFREQIIKNLSYKTKQFWLEYNELSDTEKEKRRESTSDRVDSVVGNEVLYYILGQSRTLTFREIMDTQKILLVKLNAAYEQMTSLLGSIIIGQLLLAALSRSDLAQKKRRQFNLYADEFQRFSTPAMAQLLSEARKYAIATTIAHQYREQLDEANKGATMQAASLVVFRVTSEDAQELAGAFNFAPPQAVKPPPVIPANVLSHLNRHPEKIVREFYQSYTAMFQLEPKNNGLYEDDEVDSSWDIVKHTLNELFYTAMQYDRVNIKIQEAFLARMAELFNTRFYFQNRDPRIFAALLEDKRAPFAKKIADTEADIAKREKPLASDDAFLEFACSNTYGSYGWQNDFLGHWALNQDIFQIYHLDIPLTPIKGETPEELREAMRIVVEQHKQLHVLDTREKCIAARRKWLQTVVTNLEAKIKEIEQEKKAKEWELRSIGLLFWKRNQYASPGGVPMPRQNALIHWIAGDTNWIQEIEEKIAKLQEILADDEAVLNTKLNTNHGWLDLSGSGLSYIRNWHPETVPDQIALMITLDTPEKILAYYKRRYYQQSVEPFKRYPSEYRQEQEIAIAKVIQQYEQEKAIYEPFRIELENVIQALMRRKIEVPSTEWQETIISQQTFSDKRNEIANELGNLPQATAMVKTPKGQWKITTKIGSGLDGNFTRKLAVIRKNTREQYCKSRQEVEHEIAERIRPDEQQTTQRKHTLS